MKHTMEDVEKAMSIARRLHQGQYYGSQGYYHYHILGVLDLTDLLWGYDHTLSIVSLMHDILEDTDYTHEELLSEFGEEVAVAVECLTKKLHQTRESYIDRVCTNRLATRVKIADSMFNLIESYKTGNHRLINKYQDNLKTLYTRGGWK